jgi:hypothetical protein
MKIVYNLTEVLKTALRILRGDRSIPIPVGVKKERDKSPR